jgi:hypothetical protein
MNRRGAIASFSLALPLGSDEGNQERDWLDPLPAWNYAEMLGVVREALPRQEIKSAKLLAWHTMEDGRPLRVDQALIWMYGFEASAGATWTLSCLFRHPMNTKIVPQWRIAFVTHTWEGLKTYQFPPSNIDIYKFLGENWYFNPDSSSRIGYSYRNGAEVELQTVGFRLLAS